MAITREDLRDHCAAALTRRRESYPAMIDGGRITAETAAADIEGWDILFLEWTWVCIARPGGFRPAPFGMGLSPALRACLTASVDLALRRIDTELSRLGGGGANRAELRAQQDLNLTLRLHLDAAPDRKEAA